MIHRLNANTIQSRLKSVQVYREKKPYGRCLPGVRRDWWSVPEGVRRQIVEVMSGRDPWPMYLWGLPGTGKTCAALALTDVCVRPWFEHIDDLNAIAPWEIRHWKWDEIRRRNLVIIDDIGQSGTERELAVISRIHRLRHDNPTIWIANHAPEKIADLFDRRIYSRVCSGTNIHMAGPDRRFQ